MITNFKLFENIDRPEVGDYAVINLSDRGYSYIKIGLISQYNSNDSGGFFIILYEEKNKSPLYFSKKSIEFYSKSKEDAEAFFAAKKYNL